MNPSVAEGERVEVDQRVVEVRQHEQRRPSEKTPAGVSFSRVTGTNLVRPGAGVISNF